MLKIIKNIVFLVSAFGLLALSSCVKTSDLKVRDASKLWAVHDSLVKKPFTMLDNNGIRYSFSGMSKTTEYSYGEGGVLFFTTHKSSQEYISQSCHCEIFRFDFSMSIYAGIPSGSSDVIHIYFNDLTFHYQIDNNKIDYLHVKDLSKSADLILSKVELLQHVTVRNRTYNDLIHFTLEDFPEKTDQYDVVEIFYAKGIGLVKFRLQNGATYERI